MGASGAFPGTPPSSRERSQANHNTKKIAARARPTTNSETNHPEILAQQAPPAIKQAN
jgi:hypothetical protein